MFLRWFTITIFLFSLNSAFGEIEYESVSLNPMPIKLQEIFEESFQDFQLRRYLVDSSGSKVLGINMLFTDAFAMSRVAVKYDLEGNFELNRTYHFKGFKVIHFQVSKKNIAIMYSGIHTDKIRSLIHLIKSHSTRTSLYSLFINQAHASDHCQYESVNIKIDKDIPTKSITSMLGSCLDNLGQGAYESSVGVAKSIWDSVSSEYTQLISDPYKRMNDYWKFVSEGITKAKKFMESVAQMLTDPVNGAMILKSHFGEIGDFFVKVYQNIASLPIQSKVDFICNIVGSLGVDALITAITAGAAGGKLGPTTAMICAKILKISEIVDKGIALPFKLLNSLSDKIIDGMKNIIKGGNKDLLEKRLKDMGCAF